MTDNNRIQWEQRFSDTADLLPGIICETDLNGCVTYANEFAFAAFKYSKDDFMKGVNLVELIHPDDWPRVQENIRYVYSGDKTIPREYRMVAKDGTVAHYEVTSTAMYDGEKLCGLRSCLFDISERIEAQRQLAQSEARFRRLFTESPISVALFDDDGTLIEGNGTFRRMFAALDEKRQSPSLSELVPLDETQHKRLVQGSAVQHEGYFDLTGNGADRRYLEWHISPFTAVDLGESMLLTYVQDVTERKRAEEAKLEEALRAAQTANQLVENLRQEVRKKYTFQNMVSRCPDMKRIFDSLPPIAESATTVHIAGESGTGKELIARAVHSLGPRKRKPFVAVNCSALPDNLLESELFGYKAGAFTDAKRDKPGKFAAAEGGILFLDEIGDISPAMQVKLLRVLQERTYEPLGSVKSVKTNVQVITATHRDLGAMVKEDTFRKDLFYRMNIVKITLPPLRNRRSDIPLLCDHFVKQFNRRFEKQIKGVSQQVLDRLLTHDFDGNIRELENIIEHGFVFCQSGEIEISHLPEELAGSGSNGPENTLHIFKSLDELESQYLRAILKSTGGSRIEAARKLGIHKSTLFRKLKKYGIKEEDGS